MRSLLVTGGTGMVGRRLVARLVERGAPSLRALVRSPARLREAVGPAAERVETYVADLARPSTLEDACADVDVVLHCARASVDPAARGAAAGAFRTVDVEGTLALAREAVRAGVGRFVYVSSTAAMGTTPPGVVDETTPCRPETPYQRAKRDAELGLLDLARASRLDVVVVRPCLVAGAGKTGGELLKLFRLCRRGLFPVTGRLDVEKPLVDVEDLVEALILASERGVTGEVYLVTSGGGHTLGAILQEVGRLVGNPRPYVRVPLPAARLAARLLPLASRAIGRPPLLTPERLDLFLADRRISVRKARVELGYEPVHADLRGMLERTFRWYVETGQLRA